MKQILIITRITNNQEKNEFSELFRGKLDVNNTFKINKTFKDIQLDIYSGLNFYDNERNIIAKKIQGKINNNASEVLIVIHFNNFENLKSELIKLQNNGNWKIREYSTKDDNYDYESEIKQTFIDVCDDPEKVEEIYKLFSPDKLLEAKLELLQKIAAGDKIINKSYKLDEILTDFQEDFDEFIKVGDYFSTIKDENETAFNQYKKAYDQFYDALEIED